MQSTFYKLGSVLLASLILVACQKDIKETSINGAIQSDDSRAGYGKIRLEQNSSEFGTDTYDYNKQGLLWKWHVDGYANFVHDYDKWGHLKTSKMYADDGTLINTIYFYYNKKGQRFHEIWYEGDTKTVSDELFYTFDYKGRGIKANSTVLDYYVITKWWGENISEWAYYEGGVILSKATYTYGHNLKNPFSAIPGLEFAYPFTSSFFYANKTYSTSESYYVYDENGNISESYPQDPSKTKWTRGPQGYVGTSDFFDEASQSYIHFVFDYEKGKHYTNKCNDRFRKAWAKFKKNDKNKSRKQKKRRVQK